MQGAYLNLHSHTHVHILIFLLLINQQHEGIVDKVFGPKKFIMI